MQLRERSGRRVRARALALTLAVAAGGLPVVATVATAPSAGAAGLRPFALRFGANVNGQITVAANGTVECPVDTPDPALNARCLGARTGTNATNNNSYDMVWIDVDADPTTFSSSRATLTLPPGADVLFAGLYWTGIQVKGGVITGANGYRSTPRPAPNPAQIDRVRLWSPGAAAYATVTASQVDTGPISNGSGYTAFADVTTRVRAAGPGTYTVADVQTGTGSNGTGGWSLVVAYGHPDEPLRNLSVFDGLFVVSGSSSVTVPLSGFKTPSTGTVRTTVGVVAAEGDAGATGDFLTVNGNRLTDAVHPPDNTENSTIADRGTQVTTRDPAWRNLLGYDASLFVADGFLPNSATTARFTAQTTADVYAPQAITFATELFSPQVTLTKTAAVVGGGAAEPGAEIEYTITATNGGAQQATNVELVDPIPAGTQYVGGSAAVTGAGNVDVDVATGTLVARLGAGATPTAGGVLSAPGTVSVTYRVEIDADRPLGDVLRNVATLSFVSPDLGLPISTIASVDTTVAYPDVGVVKTVDSVAGNRYTFHLDVTNTGTVATSGTVTLADTLGAFGTLVSIGGTGWTCPGDVSPCTRSDPLAPGASHPSLVVVADFAAGQPVENAADLTPTSGGQPGDPDSPARLDDHAEVSAGTAADSVVALRKTALDPVVGFGVPTQFRIEVHNQGTIDSPATAVVDTVPAGLVVQTATASQGGCSSEPGAAGTTTVTCALGTLTVGAGATVTVTVVPDVAVAGTTVSNSATATSPTIVTPPVWSADLTVRPATDLSITKTADVVTADPGDPVEYTVTVANAGPAPADDVQVVDHLPDAIDAAATITATPTGGGACAVTDRVVACDWATLAPSASVTVTVSATFSASVASADKRAVNVAEVTSLTDELDPSDNAAEVVVEVVPYADLEATAFGPGIVAPGETATLVFVNTNNGPSTATTAVTEIGIPAALQIVSTTGGCTVVGTTVTCAAGTLVDGASHTVEVQVRAPAATIGTTSIAAVHVTSAVDDPVPENNDAVVPLETPPAPVVERVEPDAGPESGGTPITVIGEHFDDETTVTLGGTACLDVVFVTASALQCTTPPGPPGPVDVVVTTADGQQAVRPAGFTYLPDPYPTFTG